MGISLQFTKEYLQACDRELNLSEGQLETACWQLDRMLRAVSPGIHPLADVPGEMYDEHCRQLIDAVVGKVCNEYARSVVEPGTAISLQPCEFPVPHDLLHAVAAGNAVDINAAEAAELQGISGIGPALADRIVAARDQRGQFVSVEQLTAVPGIGPVLLSRIREAAQVLFRPVQRFVPTAPLLQLFCDNPCLAAYLPLLRWGLRFKRSGRTAVGDDMPTAGEYQKLVLTELEAMADYVERHRWRLPRPIISAERIRERMERQATVQELWDQRSTDVEAVAVIDGRQYRHFVRELLAGAEQCIWVHMFYMYLEPGSEAGTMELIGELLEARSRGLDVRVLLDQDKEGSLYGSNVVNAEAIAYLREHEIPLVLDTGEQKTHTKTVIVDDRFVIGGSHNWTLGSLFRYDDKSLFVASRSLNARVREDFLRLWAEYGQGGGGL